MSRKAIMAKKGRRPAAAEPAEPPVAAPSVAPDARADRFRHRIREYRRVRAGDILPHPLNPRTHSAAQLAAVTGLLVDVGKIRPLIAFPADGLGPAGDFSRLMFADGHGRQVIDPDETWDVAVLDLTMAEATEALFADRTGELAGYDPVKLDALIREVNTGCAELQQMLDDLWSEAQADVIADTPTPDAPDDFNEVDETIPTDYCCPKCGYKWSGGTGAEPME